MKVPAVIAFAALAPLLAAQNVDLVDLQQPPAGSVEPGTQDHEVLQFRVYRDAGTAPTELTEVKVALNGTATLGDWDSIDLFYDADGSRDIDSGDVLLDSATTDSSGKVTFDGLSETIEEEFYNGRDYLVVVDVSSGATFGSTFEFSLDAADVTVTIGTVGAPFGTVTSNVHTVRQDTGAEMDVSLGGTPVPSSNSSHHDVGYVDEATGDSFTFTIDNMGTGTLELTGNPIIEIANEYNCAATVAAAPGTTIPAQGTDSFTVDVAPSSQTGFSFRMIIENNDFDEYLYVINVAGTAVPQPEIEIEYNSSVVDDGDDIDIGSHDAGVPATLDFLIRNTGIADLELTGSPLVGFPGRQNVKCSLQSPPSTPVTQGNTTSFTVEFTPVGGGPFTFIVWVASNDADEAHYEVVVEGSAPAVTASELQVHREPDDANATLPFDTQPVVSIAAANGAVDTSDDATTVEVSLNASNDAELSGTTTVTASGGFVHFTNLRIDKAGSYTLTFTDTSGTFPSTTSASFEVGEAPPDDDEDESAGGGGGGCTTRDGGMPWAVALAALAALLGLVRRGTVRRAMAQAAS